MPTRQPSCPAAVRDAVARRDARRFCEAILPEVSRTFALGIRVLPGALGRAVLTAYLICRIADTVEDAPGARRRRRRARSFDALLACFDAADMPGAAAAFAAGAEGVTGDPAHVALVRHADLVFAHFATLPPRTRAIVRQWVAEMVVGMRKFVLLYPDGIRIQTIEEYHEYCYYVAGTVGYLLTDLWHEHSPASARRRHARLRERCRAFAEALQTVNILKDVAHDARVGELDLRARGAAARARQHARRAARADREAENRGAIERLIRARVARTSTRRARTCC